MEESGLKVPSAGYVTDVCPEPAQSAAVLRRRAALLSMWRLTPDPALRTAIECELYGAADAMRAAEEVERFADLIDTVDARVDEGADLFA